MRRRDYLLRSQQCCYCRYRLASACHTAIDKVADRIDVDVHSLDARCALLLRNNSRASNWLFENRRQASEKKSRTWGKNSYSGDNNLLSKHAHRTKHDRCQHFSHLPSVFYASRRHPLTRLTLFRRRHCFSSLFLSFQSILFLGIATLNSATDVGATITAQLSSRDLSTMRYTGSFGDT